MKQFMKKLFRNESGGVFIMVAVAVPVLCAGLALAVDYNRYLNAKTHIANAIDQATLAAVAVDINDNSAASREEIVRRFFQTNFPEHMQELVVIKDVKVAESFPPGGPLKLDAQVTAELKNLFGGFVGMSTTQITHNAQATRDMQSNIEVVLTMASSGTMCSHKSRKANTGKLEIEGDVLISLEPDPSCEHFNALKDGVKHFVETLEDNQTISDFKVGLVPYNFKVRMPNTNNIPPVLSQNEPSGWYSDLSDARPLSAVVPLTSNVNKLKNAINDMRLDETGTAWSRSNIATLTAGLMLDPKMTNKYFSGGEKPLSYTDPSARKVVVLMTDGVNSGCCFTNWKAGNFDNQYVYFYKPDNNEQLALCKMLKENGVHIFSILFDVKAGDPGGDEINRVFAECALPVDTPKPAKITCSTQHNCYSISSAEDLRRVYIDIAQTFYKPVLSK